MAALELDDIQGNILAGFNTNVEILIGLTADLARRTEIARWLADRAPELTTVTEVRTQRSAIKAPLSGMSSSLTWLCLAMGPELLSAIRSDLFIRDGAFTTGFRRRAPTALGDRTDPDTWKVGGPRTGLDVLLIVASNDEALAEARADDLVRDADVAGLKCSYRETARRIADLEHFGFRDGISQPLIRDFDVNGSIGPGYFVFGYERDVGDGGYSPAIDPKGLLRNGSFLVFRRLAQDVRGFRDFCARKASTLTGNISGITAEHLAALLVGRWPSGALVSVSANSDPGRQPDENTFEFSDDLSGRSCPFGAHIRKVNPRNGPKDIEPIPRILRRGIPFGPAFADAPGEERGLAFISFQTSIKTQLEVLTSVWMNSPTSPGPNAGHDLLVGRAKTHRSMTIQGDSGPVQVSDDGLQWITPMGGGYLFAPGRSALSRMAEPVADGVSWRVAKGLAQVQHALVD